VRIRLYPARPQDWAKRAQRNPDTWDDDVRCIDLGNAEKVLSDALNGIAWIDDKQLRRIELERCEPDEHGARVVVEIEPVTRAPIAPSLFAEAQ
jgi:crossover junction endodeoxyribonuclease RusA